MEKVPGRSVHASYFCPYPDIERMAYFPDDPIGSILHATSLATLYTFNLTSKSPFISTMTTIASTDFYGATVSCGDGLTDSAHGHLDTLVVEIVQGI